ncbi:MAG TPA: ATP-binding protein, partial [Chitinophagaceae bacterium]|nr:ATP-binding protein [Chitinophagaceae bacterium]
MIEQLLNKAPCGIFVFADDGTILQVNDALCSLLGFTQAELHNKHIDTIFTVSSRIFYQTHFFPLVKMHGHAEEIFLTLLSAKGEHLPVLINAQRLDWEGRAVTSCAFIVVPNRKKFEDELVNARKAAEKALQENTELIKIKEELHRHTEKLEQQMRVVKEQNQELKQFSHVVTHKLREPLRKIIMYTGRLQAGKDLPIMEKLVRANEQMKAVVSALQQYVWLNERPGRFAALSLNNVVEDAVQQLSLETDPALLELHTGHLDTVEADADQLQLMFYHLFSNAVKFRKDSRAIVRISSAIVKQNTYRALESRYKYEDFARIEVIDEGMGFDTTYKKDIFELFKKLHSGSGQGLGLALCKKVVDRHNGYIEAGSELNVYTKITVWLPVRQPGSANDIK